MVDNYRNYEKMKEHIQCILATGTLHHLFKLKIFCIRLCLLIVFMEFLGFFFLMNFFYHFKNLQLINPSFIY